MKNTKNKQEEITKPKDETASCKMELVNVNELALSELWGKKLVRAFMEVGTGIVKEHAQSANAKPSILGLGELAQCYLIKSKEEKGEFKTEEFIKQATNLVGNALRHEEMTKRGVVIKEISQEIESIERAHKLSAADKKRKAKLQEKLKEKLAEPFADYYTEELRHEVSDELIAACDKLKKDRYIYDCLFLMDVGREVTNKELVEHVQGVFTRARNVEQLMEIGKKFNPNGELPHSNLDKVCINSVELIDLGYGARISGTYMDKEFEIAMGRPRDFISLFKRDNVVKIEEDESLAGGQILIETRETTMLFPVYKLLSYVMDTASSFWMDPALSAKFPLAPKTDIDKMLLIPESKYKITTVSKVTDLEKFIGAKILTYKEMQKGKIDRPATGALAESLRFFSNGTRVVSTTLGDASLSFAYDPESKEKRQFVIYTVFGPAISMGEDVSRAMGNIVQQLLVPKETKEESEPLLTTEGDVGKK